MSEPDLSNLFPGMPAHLARITAAVGAFYDAVRPAIDRAGGGRHTVSVAVRASGSGQAGEGVTPHIERVDGIAFRRGILGGAKPPQPFTVDAEHVAPQAGEMVAAHAQGRAFRQGVIVMTHSPQDGNLGVKTYWDEEATPYLIDDATLTEVASHLDPQAAKESHP